MKKFITVALLAIIVMLSLGTVSSALAEPASQTYQIYLPQVMNIGYIYLPMVAGPEPPKWTGPVGGTITSVIYDPTNPATIYAASFNGGVYKSDNGGVSWTQINKGIPTVQINTLAMDPTNPRVLYAGPYKYGIYKTTDGGNTWVNASKGLKGQAIAYSIAVDPQNPQTIYIGARDANLPNGLVPPWFGTLYKSTDGGASWSPSLANAGGTGEQDWFYSVAIDPFTHTTVYAAAHETGMYRSKDSGKTWQSISSGLGDLTTRSVVADPTARGILYTATWHRAGTYKSTNSGDRWVNYPNGSSGAKFLTLTLDSDQPSILYAGTSVSGILKSTNAGTSWANAGMNGQYFYSIAINPVDNKTILAGGDGIWKSTDQGASWHQIHWGFTASGTFTDMSLFPDLMGD